MKLNDRLEDLLRALDDLLYPSASPFDNGFLSVGSGHELFYEQSGNPDGTPVVLVHGGPGSGTSPLAPRFFDPSFFRIVCFDQRGAGRSKPQGCIKANTTGHLIADMELLREYLKIPSWLVCGGSWGVTLALAYGVSHPASCLGFLLRSVALGRAREYRWWERGMRSFFPEDWQRFADHVTPLEQGDLLGAYGRRLLSDDKEISGAAAVEWHRYEAACGSLLRTGSRKLQNAKMSELVQMAKIESHYFQNNAFLADDWILKCTDRIRHLPASIVHGRYDVICPPENAYDLAAAWPGAKLQIVDASGHQPTEYNLARALLDEAEGAKGWYPEWPGMSVL